VLDPAVQAANDALWRAQLTGEGSRFRKLQRRHKWIPGSPRCKTCLVPLSGLVSRVLRLFGDVAPSTKNPNFCNVCEVFASTHPGGAEVELTLLFADIRGSTGLAERTTPAEFGALLNRFYAAATHVLIDSDGLVDRIVGDEVVGLYLPAIGPDHQRKAVLAARELLRVTGHSDPDGPWVPVGVGVHTGTAYVGAILSEAGSDFTALGDAVNITARLASVAAAGEVLISEASYGPVRDELGELETRQLEVKGRDAPVDVRVLTVAPAGVEVAAA